MTDLRQAAQQALETLKGAREAVEHWASYADDYYKQKWNLQGDLDVIEAQIKDLKAALAETQSTHSDTCYKWHHECAVAEVNRLRAAPLPQLWEGEK